MKISRPAAACFALVMLGACTQTGGGPSPGAKPKQDADGGAWLTDPANGCKAWNRRSYAQQSFSWSGACVNGLAEGPGQVTWKANGGVDDEVFTGTWKAGRLEGRGTRVANGTRYEGEFRNGLENGNGKRTHVSGGEYVGEWKDGAFNGRGTETRANPIPRLNPTDATNFKRYAGEWKGGYWNGRGVLEFWDGSRYEGEFRSGYYHGQGAMKWAGGETYVGEWSGGRMSGHGDHRWPAKDCVRGVRCLVSYVGDHRSGARNGVGTGKWADGDSYQGEWKNDAPAGLTVAQTRESEKAAAEERRREAARPPAPSAPSSYPSATPSRDVTVIVSVEAVSMTPASVQSFTLTNAPDYTGLTSSPGFVSPGFRAAYIAPAFEGRSGGRYAYDVVFQTFGKTYSCRGTINVSGRKTNFALRFYTGGCTDAGSAEF